MKISTRELRRIIKEEKAKLLSEGKTGHAIGLGFVGWEANRRPDFAKAYGKGAKTVGRMPAHPSLSEQPRPLDTQDPVEEAFQELKYSGAYKDLQETLHESMLDLDELFNKHSDMMLQADQGSILDDLQEVMANLDNLRNTFNALR